MTRTTDDLRRRFQMGGLLRDGATGTELERRGIAAPLPLWSAAALETAPHMVRAIHRDFIEAGVDVVDANTFRTNLRTLRAVGRAHDGERLNRLALELARQAAAEAGRDVLVAGCVAPVEDCYCPERVPDEATLREEHRVMAAWLAAAGADMVWIETQIAGREARIAAEAAAAQGLPFAVSFLVDETGTVLDGTPLGEAVAAVEASNPLAIGLNCIPPCGLSSLFPRLQALTDRPLAAYAHINNATPIRGWTYAQRLQPREYAAYAWQWIEMGAACVGGCCGTTPDHIRAIRPYVKGRPAAGRGPTSSL